MSCKYFKKQYKTRSTIGSDRNAEGSDVCLLKQESEEKQNEVFGSLAKKGLEKGYVNDECPLAEESNWDECPFCKYSA
jgi:hypothetical protein